MKNIIITLLFFLSSFNLFSQGKAHVKVFSNFNYDLNSDDNTTYKAFEVKRAYLGYGYVLADDFSVKVTFDVGENSSGSSYTTFLKIAALNWDVSDRLSLNFGMIGTQNFKFMENAWGKRYIYKSFQDQNNWASSADAGVSMIYSLSNNLLINAQILNGEGFKNTQDPMGQMRGGAGVTYKADNLSLMFSRDMIPRSEYTDNFETQLINTFAMSYKISNINIGGEYNIRENTSNILDNTSTAFSLYGNLDMGNDISVFARYDQSSSEDLNDVQWNIDNEGELSIFGIEKQMTKGVKLAVNIRSFKNATYEGPTLLENEPDSDTVNSLYINLEYKF